MKGTIIGTALALVLVLAFASPSRAASEAADASCSGTSNQTDGQQRIAQTFTAQHTGSLTRASAEISMSPAGANFTVRIRAITDMGTPSATVLASAAISNVPATTLPRTLEAAFASPAQVVAGESYAISLESPPGVSVDVRTGNPCTGTLFIDPSGSDNWMIYDATWDMIFGAFVTPPSSGQTPPEPLQDQGVALATASGLAFSHTSFAAQGSGPPATSAKRRHPAHGTTVGFRLDKPATVRFTITRRAKGRKVKRGKSTVCVKPTTKNRKRSHCTRVVTLTGSFSRDGAAGHNSFHFTGRLHGHKLKPGRYRLVATPSTGGQNGKSTATGFRIVP